MEFLLLLVLVNVAILLALVGVLLRSFPERIRHLMERNSTRPNGVRSARRARREARQFTDFMANAVGGFVLLLIAASSLVIFVHRLVIHVPLVVEAVASSHPIPSKWETRMESRRLGDRYSQWHTETGGEFEAARAWGKVLCRGWPFILLAGVAVFMLGVRRFASYYVSALRELESGARQRFQEYLWRDLAVGGRRWGAWPLARRRKCRPRSTTQPAGGGKRPRGASPGSAR